CAFGRPRFRGVARAMTDRLAPEPFLSGESGTQGGWRARMETVADAGISAFNIATGVMRAIDRLAEADAPKDVLVLSVYRPHALLGRAVPKLRSERHAVTYAFGATGDTDPELAPSTVRTHLAGGKFQNRAA